MAEVRSKPVIIRQKQQFVVTAEFFDDVRQYGG
jgi:hypothetical protein